jgi:hypothetical protein
MTETTSVNILYIQATGAKGQPEDISKTSHLRSVPWMQHYFLNMNLLHVSYAATGPDRSHYVAARRYPAASRESFDDATLILPVYDNVNIFETGITYRIRATREYRNLEFSAENNGQKHVFEWDLAGMADLPAGRVGFRHMWARSSLYRNIRIYTRETSP